MKGKAKDSGWRCPDCGRRFRQRTREHSCDVRSLESHVQRGSEDVRSAFAALRRALSGLGPYDVVPLKTMVVLRTESNFGSVAFGRRFLDVSFFLPQRLEHARVLRVERLSASRLAHRVRVSAASDVDDELVSWLRRAYAESVKSSPA